MELKEVSAKYLLPEKQQLLASYKQSEPGVIPEGWNSKQLFEVVYKVIDNRGKTPPYSDDGEIELIETASISFVIRHPDYNKISKFVSRETYENWFRDHPKRNDILISTVGEYSGSSSILHIERGTIAQNLIALRIKNANPKFVFYWTKSANFRKQLNQVMMNQAQPSLRVPWLLNFNLLLPQKLTEQEAISEALSDMDALTESLEQLIAKKRQLKQGTMQELLTGKSRLPGFGEKWKVKTLGELFHFSGGFTASREQLSLDGYCYLHYGDIHTAPKTYIDVCSEYQDIPKLDIPLNKVSSASLLNDGDVVFVDASEDDEGTSKHVVVINKDKIPFISGLHTIVAKSKTNELNHQYKRYCFQAASIKSQFRFFAVGTKVSGISKTNIARIMLPVPTIFEQVAIAEILNDMDTEIAALETKLAKARKIKQGMMQELLTGRIRLV